MPHFPQTRAFFGFADVHALQNRTSVGGSTGEGGLSAGVGVDATTEAGAIGRGVSRFTTTVFSGSGCGKGLGTETGAAVDPALG